MRNEELGIRNSARKQGPGAIRPPGPCCLAGDHGGKPLLPFQFLIPNSSFLIKIKCPPSQSLGTKGKPSAVPPKFILTEYALDAPVTEGGPAVSPRRLPGEPNRTSAVWLAAGGQTSLGGVSRLFSRSSLITINTYSTETGQMQAPIRRNSADRGGNFQLKSRPSTRSSTWMADTTPSVMKKEMCLQ